MPQPARDDVLRVLRGVVDPSSGKSVIDAGRIQGLVIKAGNVGFAIEVPAALGPASEPLRQECEAAVAALAGVTSVTAVLTAHRGGPGATVPPPSTTPPSTTPPSTTPPSTTPPSTRAQRQMPRLNGIDGVTAIIAVASGKGGVGKSTVAANLALALVKLGKRVGLLDADIYGPSVPRLFAITGKPESDGKRIQPIMRYGLKTMSIGFMVAEDQAMIWRGPMVQSALTQMLNDVAWSPLDILLVDMPPGTGDAQLTMTQQVPLKGAVIVSTPQDIALIDARRGIAMFEKTNVPILGIIENMSTFRCPHCGGESHIFGHGGAKAEAARLNVPFLGEIPLVPEIRALSDAGTPIIVERPQSAEAEAFLALARQVSERLDRILDAGRTAPRIVME